MEKVAAQLATRTGQPASIVLQLAQFRYRMRKFLRFSEKAARACGVTPLQHQLMLGVAGFTGRGWATVSELAEFLQERHNAVVALVDRAAKIKLVRREPVPGDRRVVRVELTANGRRLLSKLLILHRSELSRFQGSAELVPSQGTRQKVDAAAQPPGARRSGR